VTPIDGRVLFWVGERGKTVVRGICLIIAHDGRALSGSGGGAVLREEVSMAGTKFKKVIRRKQVHVKR
jgi:hypothetical protein